MAQSGFWSISQSLSTKPNIKYITIYANPDQIFSPLHFAPCLCTQRLFFWNRRSRYIYIWELYQSSRGRQPVIKVIFFPKTSNYTFGSIRQIWRNLTWCPTGPYFWHQKGGCSWHYTPNTNENEHTISITHGKNCKRSTGSYVHNQK